MTSRRPSPRTKQSFKRQRHGSRSPRPLRVTTAIPSPSSPPGLTRWSMLTLQESNTAATLSKSARCMDCRVKPGNDDVRDHSRDANAPGSCQPPPSHEEKSAPTKREAKRRKAHAQPCPRSTKTSPFRRCFGCLGRGCALISGARPPSGASTAALATGYHPDGSAPEPGFLKAARTGVLPARRKKP
jgi:hypothetical protein